LKLHLLHQLGQSGLLRRLNHLHQLGLSLGMKFEQGLVDNTVTDPNLAAR
jgi:hypothetical protein